MRLTTFFITAACAAAAAGGAGATGTTGAKGGAESSLKCGPRMSVLVWPHGHPLIPSINFPEIRNPHVEVYVGYNQKYPEQLYAGYVLGGKPQGVIPSGNVNFGCVNYGAPATAAATVAGGVTYTSQTGLRCTLPAVGVIDVLERPKQTRVMILHRGNQVLLRAEASPTKASVTVPKGACTRQPVPK
jgi:hypothetical protein